MDHAAFVLAEKVAKAMISLLINTERQSGTLEELE
jgi:hypothetical protein